MSRVIKVCACGLKYTREGWAALDYVGSQFTPEDEYGPDEALELRTCSCGSTIAISLDPSDPADPEFINADGVLAHFLGGEVLS